MKIAPADAGIRDRLARLLLQRGETDRARALLADAVAEKPGDPEVRLLLAETELQAGRRTDALRESTAARQEVMDFTRPYAVFHEGVLVRRGDPIASPADLVGKRVAAIEASTNMSLALTL